MAKLLFAFAVLVPLGCVEKTPESVSLGRNRQAVVAGQRVTPCETGGGCVSGYCIDVEWLGLGGPRHICTTRCSEGAGCAEGWECREEQSPGGVREGFCIPMMVGEAANE